MAFNLFKKKEIIENNREEKNDKDIVEDFGSFVSNSTNSNDLSFSSFDSNFQENISDELNTIYNTNKSNETLNVSDNFSSSFNENINSNNMYNTSNVDNSNMVSSSTYLNQTSNMVENYDNKINNTRHDISLNINNYDYNPIMNNIDSIPNNIKNSQDINVVLSYLANPKKSSDDENIIPQNSNSVEVESNDSKHNNTLYEVDPGHKICPKCGQKMREDYKQCFVCGTMF